MHAYLIGTGISVGIMLAMLIPFVVAGTLISPRPRRLLPLCWFALLFALNIYLVSLPEAVAFVPAWGGWNWQGKLLELVWPILLVALVPACSPERVGCWFRIRHGSWRVLLYLCAAYAVLFVLFVFVTGAGFNPHFSLPAVVYEATLPGLAEEFVFRGVLLMLLNDTFGRPWHLFGARFGWGAVIVSVLFGFVHGVDATSLSAVQIHWMAMIIPFLIGLVLAWLRERSGSVWPCVVFHNFVNVLAVVLT